MGASFVLMVRLCIENRVAAGLGGQHSYDRHELRSRVYACWSESSSAG